MELKKSEFLLIYERIQKIANKYKIYKFIFIGKENEFNIIMGNIKFIIKIKNSLIFSKKNIELDKFNEILYKMPLEFDLKLLIDNFKEEEYNECNELEEGEEIKLTKNIDNIFRLAEKFSEQAGNDFSTNYLKLSIKDNKMQIVACTTSNIINITNININNSEIDETIYIHNKELEKVFSNIKNIEKIKIYKNDLKFIGDSDSISVSIKKGDPRFPDYEKYLYDGNNLIQISSNIIDEKELNKKDSYILFDKNNILYSMINEGELNIYKSQEVNINFDSKIAINAKPLIQLKKYMNINKIINFNIKIDKISVFNIYNRGMKIDYYILNTIINNWNKV